MNQNKTVTKLPLPRNLALIKSDFPIAKATKEARDAARSQVEELRELLDIVTSELETQENALVVLRQRCGQCGTCPACQAVRS